MKNSIASLPVLGAFCFYDTAGMRSCHGERPFRLVDIHIPTRDKVTMIRWEWYTELISMDDTVEHFVLKAH